MKNILKRSWVEISLNSVQKNYNEISGYLNSVSGNPVKIMAMVKADAYGHGAPMIARTLEKCGVSFFGVSSIDEATQLRNSGITTPILITGYTPSEFIKTALDKDVSLTVYNMYTAERISSVASKLGKIAKIHLKIDTGMNRLGFLAEHDDELSLTVEKIKQIYSLPYIFVEGTYTHLSDADNTDKAYTEFQIDNYKKLLNALKDEGLNPGIRHCLNSAGIIAYPESAFDMVRPGLILYGLLPSPSLKPLLKFNLTPAMVLKAAVSQVKTVKKGAEISYGRSEILEKDSKMAVLPIGYADGLLRCLSNNFSVTVSGKPAKITGKICMDQTIVNITNIPDVCEGDEAVIFGDGTDGFPTIDDMATLANTLNYEICCIIGKRVPRLYFENDALVGRLNYILNKI